jgi:hypothetical protein
LETRVNSQIAASAALRAEEIVRIRADQARQWFLELETCPERYQFETHEGFAFTQGSFGQAGARFQTIERFYWLRIALSFELIEMGEQYVRFRLIRPPLPIWGAFVLTEVDAGCTRLCLAIGGTARLGTWVLRTPLIRGAVQRQIRGEVEHVKASMEAAYSL